MRGSPRTTLLAILVVIASSFALKYTASVALPLVFGLFLVCLLWPLQTAVSPPLKRGLGALLGVLVFLGVSGAFVWALYALGDVAQSDMEGRTATLESTWDQLRRRGTELGLQFDESWISGYIKRLGKTSVDLLAGFTLTTAILGLGLYEVRDFADKIEGDAGHRWASLASDIARQMRRYFVVRTGIGALTGALVAGGSWAIGLELWWLWGLLNFLLNFIPTLGSIIGVVPPVLFALVQGDGDPTLPLLAFGVVGGVQLVMGNWIDPLVQGRALSLSPLVVLLSVVFWGWVWGVVGALIGVPMTLMIVLIAREFESTRPIARLLLASAASGGDPNTT